MKTIKDIQEEVRIFVENSGSVSGYYSPMILASLLKVLLNLSDIFTNFYNFKKTSKLEYKKIEEEIEYLLFNIICLANNHGIDLEKILNNVVSNLT